MPDGTSIPPLKNRETNIWKHIQKESMQNSMVPRSTPQVSMRYEETPLLGEDMERSTGSPKENNKNRQYRKYGDIISSATYLLLGITQVIPAVEQSPSWETYFVAFLHVLAVIVGCLSWFWAPQSLSWTIAMTLSSIGVQVAMVVLNVPSYPDSPLMEVFLWLIVMVNANIDIPHSVSILSGLACGLAGIASIFFLPAGIRLDKVLTMQALLGAMGVHSIFHWYLLKREQEPGQANRTTSKRDKRDNVHDRELLTINAARAVLAGVFVYNLVADVAAITAQAALQSDIPVGASIAALAVKAGLVFSVGLVAVGTFRKSIDENERLESLVQKRTSQLEQRDSKLHVFGLALQGSETAFAITDSRQEIIWSNPALARLAGCGELELAAKSVVRILSLSSRDRQRFHQAFNVSSSPTNQVTLEMMDSNTIVNAEVAAFDTPEGQLFVVSMKDVTEAEALKRAQESAERDAMLAKVMKESMETLTHELRTPLQGILGMTSMLVSDASLNLPIAAKDSLDIIMASSGLLLVLINNLLDVRKCDADMMDEFELAATLSMAPVRDSVSFCRPLAKISGVTMVIDSDERVESSVVLANELRLQQIIINLISNAVKYAPHGTVINIETTCSTTATVRELANQALTSGPNRPSDEAEDDDPVLLVTVKDCGPGIAPGQELRLFRKFAQLDSHETNIDESNGTAVLHKKVVGQPGGTGLGLNLCLQFVQLMKGNIWVNNNPEDSPGAAFSFYLPLARGALPLKKHLSSSQLNQMVPEECAEHTSQPQPEKTIGNSVDNTESLRILVVDDTLINRKVLGRMLRKIGITHVALAESGEEALVVLEKVISEKNSADFFDFVITDLQMPGGMSGIELSETIRKMSFSHDASNPKEEQRPIVVGLTADTSPDLYGRCVKAGMMDVVHKPITLDELSDALVRWQE